MAANRRIATRNMDELIGMCRMVIADGIVEDHEARLLLDWIESHYHAAEEWPGNILYQRLCAAMTHGHLNSEEESELLEVLGKIVGGPPSTQGPNVTGLIPYDQPPPSVVFPGQCFVLTGQFIFGSRREIVEVIEGRGGAVASAISGKCNYLVVGTFGSDEWLHSNYGTKIMKAVELKSTGKPIRIIAEKHWTEQLGDLHG
jgi:NAD-dependent DNA ligase